MISSKQQTTRRIGLVNQWKSSREFSHIDPGLGCVPSFGCHWVSGRGFNISENVKSISSARAKFQEVSHHCVHQKETIKICSNIKLSFRKKIQAIYFKFNPRLIIVWPMLPSLEFQEIFRSTICQPTPNKYIKHLVIVSLEESPLLGTLKWYFSLFYALHFEERNKH